jgi:lipoprotein-releasing system permease protein
MSGLALGALICFLQMQYGLIRFDTGTTFVVNAYPVVMQWGDFVLILLTVTGISLFSALFPASKITSKYLQLTTQEK